MKYVSCQFQCDAVDPVDIDAVGRTVRRALATYGTPAIREMIQNCMAQDLSWKVSIYWMWSCSFAFENVFQSKRRKKTIWGVIVMQGPAKVWEKLLLSLEVAGGEPGIEGDEIAPLAKENVATP